MCCRKPEGRLNLLFLSRKEFTYKVSPSFPNIQESSTYYCDSYGKVRCLPGWTDPYNLCQTPVCTVNNQTCVNGNCSKPFTCDCEVGWMGQFCEKCVPLPGCVNGYCNRSLECKCNEGWEGMICDKRKLIMRKLPSLFLFAPNTLASSFVPRL